MTGAIVSSMMIGFMISLISFGGMLVGAISGDIEGFHLMQMGVVVGMVFALVGAPILIVADRLFIKIRPNIKSEVDQE